jgi:hypothetical protein
LRALGETIVFGKRFLLKGFDRILSAAAYRVVTDEERVKGISSGLPARFNRDLLARWRRERLYRGRVD